MTPEDRSQPNSFQLVNNEIGKGVTDPLGALDNQGQIIMKNDDTDPIGALESPSGGRGPSPLQKNVARLKDKMRDVYSLSYHYSANVEEKRAANLTKL